MLTLTAGDRSHIESLLTEFYWRLDHPGASSVSDLFAEPGTIVTPRSSLQGREQIDAWFGTRNQDPGRITRHSFSNLRITPMDSVRAKAEAHVQTSTRAGAADAGIEWMLGETTDAVVKGPGLVWLFESRRLAIILQTQLPNAAAAREEGHP